ncbi:neurexin-1a-like [Clytia hemisphaerica]|uniref:Uncharacterized protein n=1 Tax=Clytia hemisphaerica TaxID=252671 RepID=A0A7M5TWH7_9CNID|eukprot:TCONS_00000690-protein
MSISTIIIFLLALQFGFLGASLPENKLTFINHDHSTIKLRPSTWKHNEGYFQFHIKVNQEDGTVITIINKNKQVFTLTVSSGKLQTSHPQKVPLNNQVVTNKWNQIKLLHNSDNNLVQLHVNGESAFSLDDQQWGIPQWDEVWLGAYRDVNSEKSNSSFIGCLKLSNHHRIPHINHLIERRGLVLDDCIDTCAVQMCQNGGTCVNNYRNVTCDCMGTGFEGVTCEKEAATYSLKKNEKIEMLKLPEVVTRSSTPSTIKSLHMRIRTSQPNGVIFQFTNLLKEAIKMELHDGILNVKVNTVRDKYSTSIGNNLHDNQWHSITLTIKSDEIQVSMDQHLKNEIFKATNGGTALAAHHKPSIVIGGADYVGCLQQIYFNGFDIIDSLLSKGKYFEAKGGKPKCEK